MKERVAQAAGRLPRTTSTGPRSANTSSRWSARGVSPNVASFVGATTVRVHELGDDDRDPTAAELARMQDLVRDAMREGALGVGSSLIYAPAFFAETPELDRAGARRGASPAAATSRTSAMKATALEQATRRTDRDHARRRAGTARSITSRRRARRTGRSMARAIAQIEAARARGPARSPPTCIPTPPARPGSMQRCRSGCRRAASTRGSRG